MEIQQAEFITSSVAESQCPKPLLPEYAFIGRSNVGKSRLINMITGSKKLAKVSGSPGKTITMNHFLINKSWYLVDLPGYGFAKRSKTERKKWERMIRHYILTRSNLLSLFLLIDIRLEPQKNDMEFMEWLAMSEIPFVLTFTKADKLGKTGVDKNLAAYKKTLLQKWEELPPIIVTSSVTGAGREEILRYIEKTNAVFQL
ncbi:ribosome biogenesis GTP-binding protein YihA/YsxC [Candidatus Sulfidibacterium hydrothermale]|uniref:ribosome biogenesis GTP-binding protein YihA/YsxC n=1 Tax=Candidatus Sulfidibacterium hydrothermale TaxID=2875962 RepID=UPI001F0A33A7|nr:ribosome biogenesis GTP-binding protein YihA/YsxC [Candidatus Sulfidibacterium hydrothermale]UBM63037.1 ribosome biogenesis GTP-binding protein YihA/YsxC [Candidatus Sulfidibacterium hydrothermale]